MNIEEIRAKARSSREPYPTGTIKVAEEEKYGKKYEYFRTPKGEYLYETDVGEKLKKKIEDWAKQKRDSTKATSNTLKKHHN